MKASHCINGTELDGKSIVSILDLAMDIKNNPGQYAKILQNKHVAMIFEKPSLRTYLTFTTGIQSMGGLIAHLPPQGGREAPRDIIRVIQRHCQALVIRTSGEDTLYEMREYARIPIINGLSDNYHPCQTLADILTLRERFGKLDGLSLCYIGDGNNVLRSLMVMAPKVGVSIRAYCPAGRTVVIHPEDDIDESRVHTFNSSVTPPEDVLKECSAVYTDVWQSMGFEKVDESAFITVDDELMSRAKNDAVFMHCLPAHREKEVTSSVLESNRSVIFQQSENRQYVQQALLYSLIFNLTKK